MLGLITAVIHVEPKPVLWMGSRTIRKDRHLLHYFPSILKEKIGYRVFPLIIWRCKRYIAYGGRQGYGIIILCTLVTWHLEIIHKADILRPVLESLVRAGQENLRFSSPPIGGT